MKKLLLTVVIAVLGIILLTGCGCQHVWEESTCIMPKTCSKCGKKAGDTSDHTWMEATCISPKKCSVCKITEGNPTEHTVGEWEIESYSFIEAEKRMYKRCTVCDNVQEREIEGINSFHEDGKFLFTPYEFEKNLKKICENEEELNNLDVSLYTNDGVVSMIVLKHFYERIDDHSYLNVVFSGKKYKALSSIDTADVKGITLYSDEGSYDSFIQTAYYGIVMACDPTLNIQDAKKMLEDLLEEFKTNSSAIREVNGITYAITAKENESVFSNKNEIVYLSCYIN